MSPMTRLCPKCGKLCEPRRLDEGVRLVEFGLTYVIECQVGESVRGRAVHYLKCPKWSGARNSGLRGREEGEARCSCEAPIIWSRTPQGKRIPLQPVLLQIVRLDGKVIEGRETHFAYCEDAGMFR